MRENYLLILFYSLSGSVKNLAHAIADGAEQESITVKIRTVPKVSANTEIIDSPLPKDGEVYCSKEDIENCAGLALGSPTRFGSMASSLKYFLGIVFIILYPFYVWFVCDESVLLQMFLCLSV